MWKAKNELVNKIIICVSNIHSIEISIYGISEGRQQACFHIVPSRLAIQNAEVEYKFVFQCVAKNCI